MIEKLKPNPSNPRTITEVQFKKLKASIGSFSKMLEVRPIAYDEDNVIWGGNMRFLALKELAKDGLEIKDSYFKKLENYTSEEKKEFAIRDNVEFGEWDFDSLANEWSDLPLDEWGIDTSGWQLDEVIEDEAPEVSSDPAISQLGEVYQLGRHKLMCGDSTKIEDVEKLMNGQKADMIFTDPPYGVNYQSQSGNSYNQGKYAHMGKIFNDDKTSEENLEFFRDVLSNLYVASKDTCVIYWWLAFNSNAMENLVAFKQSGWKMSQQIIWVKERFVFSRGQDFHRMSEPCFFGWKEGKTHWTNKKINNLSDVFNLEHKDIQALADIWFENRDKTTEYVHPTQKPVRLAHRWIAKSSQSNQIILDAFGGSGSTMSACEQSGRIAYLMELDPHYADVIRKRYAKFINKEEEWQTITAKI